MNELTQRRNYCIFLGGGIFELNLVAMIKIKKYYSQKEVAKMFNTTPRMLLYWESIGLIHPMNIRNKKERVYEEEDIKEIAFVKALLDSGYTTSALKEKLKNLLPPYAYDINNMFWDYRDNCFKTRKKIAYEVIKEEVKELLKEKEPEVAIINYVFDIMEKE